MISGDSNTSFDPVVFVNDGDDYEVLCRSFSRQKYWYNYLQKSKPVSFEKFLSTFTYQNVEYGDVTDEVQSLLNKLRAKYMVEHIAQAEQEKNKNQPKQSDTERALLAISKRIRTGENERA